MIIAVNTRCSGVAVLGTHPSLRRSFCARLCQRHSLQACEHRLRRGQATGGKIYAFTDVTASIEQSRALVLEAIEGATMEQWIAAGGAGIGITALIIQLKRAIDFVSSAIVFDEASALTSVEETLSAVDPVTPSYPPEVTAENEKLLMDAGRAEARQRSLVWMLFLTFMTFFTLDILVGDTAMQP